MQRDVPPQTRVPHSSTFSLKMFAPLFALVALLVMLGSSHAGSWLGGSGSKSTMPDSQGMSQVSMHVKPHLSAITAAMMSTAQAKLKQYQQSIATVQQHGDITLYQQHLKADQALFDKMTNSQNQNYSALLIQLGSDLANIQKDVAAGSASVMLDNYLQEAQTWGEANAYHDSYDGKSYSLNSGYLEMPGFYGNGTYLRNAVESGAANATNQIEKSYFLHEMLEANFVDQTPYDQAHATDAQMLAYEHIQDTRVLVVSLTEQALRIYDHGKLEAAYHVTTGRYTRPTPPGLFPLTLHQYHLWLTSADPVGSPEYYAPIMVNYAITFRDNGYLIHDAPWRHEYGPNTQLPHHDSGGDPLASEGSHGCVELPTDALAKLDGTLTPQSMLLVY